MTRRNLLLSLIGSAIACLTVAAAGQAAVPTVPRAFVSTTGNDSNPCSALQPCRSFNQALTVVEPGGEIVVQDSGGYSSGFTISQSVTIDAAGFNASVISTSATSLCTISAGASDRVVLRGITFHGARIGINAINVTQVGSLYIEHCSISEFAGDGVFMTTGGTLVVTGTDVRKCFNGLEVGTGSATALNLVGDDSRFSECDNNGVDLASSGSGAARGLLSNCAASQCASSGFSVFAGNSSGGNVDLVLDCCRASGNGHGVFVEAPFTATATARLANCVVTQNGAGVIAEGAHAAVIGTSPGTSFISGNAGDGAPGSSVVLH
jgi:hypothetical protein